MREPDVLKECWETLKRKISPIPNKTFPEDLLRRCQYLMSTQHRISFLCVAVGLSYLFYFNKEETMGKTFFKGWQFKLTPKQAIPQVPCASAL